MNDLYTKIKNGNFLISGPCVLEDYEKSIAIANFVSSLCEKYNFTYIFKASFDKANRTSIDSFRGPGIEKGMEIFKEISKNFYTITDIHTPSQADKVADYVDIIQIPAFLSRQTDLLIAAGNTNKIVNIKKFQLLSGKDMLRPIEKVVASNNEKIILTERGTMIPYGNLVVDLRNIVDMVSLGYPVVMDCTHSCQALTPGQKTTSGRKEMANIYGQAAAICGVKGFFAETYEKPELAKSDSKTSLNYNEIESLVKNVDRQLRISRL